LDTNNVCAILELSVTFDIEDLRNQCLGFVANQSESVLNGDEILDLSRESLQAILKVERIMSGPSTLFTSCVKWARHQLQVEHSIKDPNDLQIRKTLGGLLYEIPFPAISATEFAHLVGESDIVTNKEKSAVYYYLASRRGKDKLKFRTENRHERLVNLATKCTKGLLPQSQCSACGSFKKSTVELSFKTNKDILLTGIGFYTAHNGSDYAVDIQVIQEKDSLLQDKLMVQHTENSTSKVSFDKPVSIVQGMLYKISAFAHKDIGYYGELCSEICVDDVTFAFVSVSPNASAFGLFGAGVNSIATSGQIPQLYFIAVKS